MGTKIVNKIFVNKLAFPIKGVVKQGPFCFQKWVFCKQFSPLRERTFVSIGKGKFVFQKSFSETPFKLDRVSFCTAERKKQPKHKFSGGISRGRPDRYLGGRPDPKTLHPIARSAGNIVFLRGRP